MKASRKSALIIMMIIILASHLAGQSKTAVQIKASGKLIIPTAAGDKSYRCDIVITRTEIRLECHKKIFQPFNRFDIPKQARLRVNTADIVEIQVQYKKNAIYIVPKDSFSIRYRNIFQRASKIIGFEALVSPVIITNWALVFKVNTTADIEAAGEGLIKIIGKRCAIIRN